MKFLLAKKLGMTTVYADGIAKNVTLLEAAANVITQVRTAEKDGYTAVQIGLKRATAKKGKSEFEQKREFRVDSAEGLHPGDAVSLDQFELEDKVDVIGISKGKGFQGVMKRHNFSGSPATHGHRHDHRAPGSIGCAFPEHVFKGKKMAGRMGTQRCTMKNLSVALIDKDKTLLAVEGAVPGNVGSIVQIVKRA